MDSFDIIRSYDDAEDIVFKAMGECAYHGAKPKVERVHDYIVKQSQEAFKAFEVGSQAEEGR